ncbi:GNAT family N-acetyltransferase [Sphingomonas dokdonensis]|uniref:Acetyltransferase (GNAT) family protein n=1 Tax=Sphingomonas dokdonensis TaxID=344880 RepID=A0A245ZII4_9SPHN|nr:GNAT family N-acetyltransferase [Sphingomonas dokdonensis]OWK29546.1 acetyltransferase (GNAT) family protein [Sphingomonas dokdonensis]
MIGPPASPIAIRPLTTADLPQAMAIQSLAYPAFLREDAAAFASRLTLRQSCCLAATRADTCGETLIAYLLAHGWPSRSPPAIGTILSEPDGCAILFIHDLAVAPVGRGTAVGRRLVDVATGAAARQGLARAELIAVDGAAPYWQRLGFAEETVSPALADKVAAYGPAARWMTRPITPEIVG